MTSLTIDGISIEAPAGTTVLQAAQQAGITIPTLCNHPALVPYGGCRLCVVEVQGFRTPIASCTLPVSQGMVIQTNTEKLRSIRKFVLTMLFSERNHFCPFCQKTGGDCELQNSAYAEEMTHWPISPSWTTFNVDASHPYFVLDHNRCILCRRCVRACAAMTGNFTLGVENRGARTLVVADYGVPLGESSCIRCGSCVQVCPTGALIERQSAYQGLEKDATEITTICTACSVGCGIRLLVRDNRIIRILGDWDAPVNNGVLCVQGRYEARQETRERLLTPLIRRSGGLAPATWDEAIQLVSARLQAAGGSIAALASSRLPAENLYAFKQLFSAGLHSRTVACIEEDLTSARPADATLEGDLQAVKSADCVLVVGADLVKSHQVAGFFIKRNRPSGVTIILIDPNENEMESVAHYSLRCNPGSDQALLRGVLAGVVNLGFNKNPNTADYDPELINAASQASGIPAETLVAVSRELGAAQSPVIIYGKGITRSVDGNLAALEELAHACGARLINPQGKANSMAASLYGLNQQFTAAGHELAYVTLGDDFATSRLQSSLQSVPFLVVQASYMDPLVESADVVLPVEMWAELDGHFINLEGRLQKANQAVTPPQMVLSNQAVFDRIAAELHFTLDANWRGLLVPAN